MEKKGGDNPHDLIYKALSAIIPNEIAVKYSYTGQKGNKKFNGTALCTCVVRK